MVNSNSKSPAANSLGGSPPAQHTGGSVPAQSAGNGSNPAGNGGGGTASSGSPAPGVIPGSGTKAKRGARTEVTLVATGLGTQIPDGSAITVRGVPVSKAQLLAQCAAALALFANVDAAVQALKNERLALEAGLPDVRQFLSDLRAALVAHFGRGNPVLVAFGFSVKKPRQLTVEQKLARKEKALQTRDLRGTKGPRQKQNVVFQGKVDVQTSVSGTPTSGGNTSPTGSSSAGAPSTPSGSGTAGPGSTPTSGA